VQQKARLFNYLVGAGEQRRWDGEIERLGGIRTILIPPNEKNDDSNDEDSKNRIMNLDRHDQSPSHHRPPQLAASFNISQTRKVAYWPIADARVGDFRGSFRGQSGHRASIRPCPLMTQSGGSRFA
jgi:hypothetical protein